MNLSRISTIATNVFRAIVRDRILYLLGFYIFILASTLFLLPEVSGTANDKMFLDLGLAAMTILGLIVAIFMGTSLINQEIEKRTVLVFIAKPISRSEFVIGKYVGLVAVLASLVAVMTVIYLVFLQVGNINYPAASILISAIFLILQLSLISAVAIAFSMVSNSLLATPLTIAVYFIGNITEDILTWDSSSGFKRLAQGLYLVLPDLSRLDLKNDAVYGLGAIPDPATLFANGLYGIFYSLMVIAIAILIFSQREF